MSVFVCVFFVCLFLFYFYFVSFCFKIHGTFQFDQKPWLKPYIDFNTTQRARTINEFEKNFLKLMNNAVFGKTIGNLRNRRNITLVNNRHKLMELVAQLSLKSFEIFHEDHNAVERAKVELLLNRPITVSFSILGKGKTLMYKFHDDYIK